MLEKNGNEQKAIYIAVIENTECPYLSESIWVVSL